MFGLSRKKSEYGDIYFRDPLLQMGYSERLAVRVVTNAWVIVHVVGTIILLLTDIEWVFWLGVLSSLYLLDRLLHYSKPEEYLPSEDGMYGNLVLYLSPRARRAVISAYNKATILGGGFFLNLARVLSETKSVLEMLARLEVDDKEFNSKLDAYLGKDSVSYRDKERLSSEAEHLVFAAFGNRGKRQRSIDYAGLFAALGDVDNEQLVSLFRVFEISSSSLRGVTLFGKLINRLGRPKSKRFVQNNYNLSENVNSEEGGQISTAKRILSCKVLELEREYKVFVLYSAIETAIKSAEKYFHDKSLPDSAEDLMREAVVHVSSKGDNIVRSDDITVAAERLISAPSMST